MEERNEETYLSVCLSPSASGGQQGNGDGDGDGEGDNGGGVGEVGVVVDWSFIHDTIDK